MKFGISTGKIDEIGYITHAENLGYDFCWVSDTQMIRSNPWAVLALAAQATRTIALGPGVAIPALRLAPVMANSIATINRLAPGRTFLGLGTGHTAMRAMGQRPMRLAAFAEYVRVVRALIDGEEVDYTLHGKTNPIRFSDAELGYIDVEHRIPIHIGGFGPRAQALAGELGDGLITGIPRGGSVSDAMSNARQGAARAGRDLVSFHLAALVNVLMLEPGQSLTDPEVVNRCGPSIMANVHYLHERCIETGEPPPDYVASIWDEYLAHHARLDAERAYQSTHQTHYKYLAPEEARFVTPEIIRHFCIAGAPEEIVERLKALEIQGLDAVAFIAPLERQYRMSEDFAREVMSRM
jgi:alkanesulfonate monooxygenase SsuD/methylene tetrahydromethanopterin reductase-like flavin-dependent oxidoreductase (luciferase family)